MEAVSDPQIVIALREHRMMATGSPCVGDHPLATVHAARGDAVPGAFELTGTTQNEICVRVWPSPESSASARMTVAPEMR